VAMPKTSFSEVPISQRLIDHGAVRTTTRSGLPDRPPFA
jgi:hypothetical protein